MLVCMLLKVHARTGITLIVKDNDWVEVARYMH